MVRIIHTADAHIGKVFNQFGRFGQQLRAQIKATFSQVFALAGKEHVDAVVLAGDIFDSARIALSDIQFFMDVVCGQPNYEQLFEGKWVTLFCSE